MNQNLINAQKIQNYASNPQNNVYLSASAGTGKTKTLVDRILRLLLNNVKIERILCITYTNVAAKEMFQRLNDTLKHWSLLNDMELNQCLVSLLGSDNFSHEISKRAKELYNYSVSNVEKFRIQTIHSFCVDFLNQGKFLSQYNVEESLKIIDDHLRNELIDIAFDKIIQLSHKDKKIKQSLEVISTKYDYLSLSKLLKNIFTQKQMLFNFFSSKSSIEEHLRYQDELYEVKNKDFNMIKEEFFFGISKKFQDSLQNCQKEESVTNIISWIEGDFSFKEKKVEEYIKYFLTKSRAPRKKIPISKSTLDSNYEISYFYRLEQKRVINFLNDYFSLKHAEFIKSLIILLKIVSNELEDLKNDRGYLEYDDLIIKTLEIKTKQNKNILKDLNLSFEHILIDEAQDISKVQWNLITSITKELNHLNSSIFIVGDFKQSIYGFQGASPEHFLDIGKYYNTQLNEQKKFLQHLELNYSFRSKKEILEGIDTIFSSLNFVGKIQHLCIKQGVGIFQIIEHSKKIHSHEISGTGWLMPKQESLYTDKEFLSAKEIANFVINLLDKNPNDNGEKTYGDVMILFRKRCKKMRYLKRMLEESNIPISYSYKLKFNENIIVLDLLSIIRFYLLPEDDLNLLSLLKSPFFNFNEKHIFDLCYKKEKNSIWHRLQILFPDTHLRLSDISYEIENRSLHDFYVFLLYQSRYITSFSQKFGEDHLEIIDFFMQKVTEFESLLLGDKQVFLDWMSQDTEILLNNDNYSSVRIMTIHAAKGLQSRVVVLADVSYLDKTTPNEPFYWYNDSLILPNINLYKSKVISQFNYKKKIQAKNENLRLLYVAMTRAESELYIFVHGDKDTLFINTAKKKLSQNIVKYQDLKIDERKFSGT